MAAEGDSSSPVMSSRTPTPRPKDVNVPTQQDSNPARGFDIERFRRHVTCHRREENFYTNPVTLPCMDTFCSDCLPEFAREQQANQEEVEERPIQDSIPHKRSNTPVFNRDTFKCPKGCRIDTGITINEDGTLNGVPAVNESLNNVIRTFKLKENLPQGRIMCGECKDSIAIAICNNRECANKPLCGDCLNHHIKTTDARDHLIARVNVPLQEIDGGNPPSDMPSGASEKPSNGGGGEEGRNGPEEPWWKLLHRRNWYCHQHHRLVDIYCEDCDVVICERCVLFDHLNCSFKPVDEACDECMGPIEVQLYKVKELRKKFEAAIYFGKKIKESLDFKKTEKIKSINSHCDQLIQQINTHRNNLVEKTERICELKKAEIQKHQNFLEIVFGNINRSSEFIDDAIQTFIPVEFMFIKTQIANRLNELELKYKRENCNRKPSDDDEIFLILNDSGIPETLIGSVFSTPHVKKFKFANDFPQHFEATRSYAFTLTSRDIAETRVSSRNLPRLEALISPCVDRPRLPRLDPQEEDFNDAASQTSDISTLSLPNNGIECVIRPSNSNDGTYRVMIFAPMPGRHKLYIYWPRSYPHKQYFIQGCPLTIDVDPPTFDF